jgi:glycosyltransferase involved in cell wall biosynthesis
LFDYLRAGIPVLASDLPEVRKIVETYKTGWIVEKVEPKIMADQVKKIIHSTELYQSIKLGLSEASNKLSWEVESKVLEKWY